MRGPDTRTTQRARQLRKADNDAESKLWAELRGRRLNGYKFNRQFPIGPYFADFACREAKLVVEVDGSQHADSERDRLRDDFMVSAGWSIVRLWNVDVFKAREQVLETILAAIEKRLSPEITAYELRYIHAGQRGAVSKRCA
ncbi:endonuclease domain-containing protein [Pseudaminobacter sp. NGMCC 1.201702]|uniref:endonuclease domain-containing protein n=1 Tax=Pseudaminobacter sp. NGMCC 1.201702 TaxID=3391825 RepID=UPI0039EFFFFD